MPGFLMYVAAIFDKRITWAFLKGNLSKNCLTNNERIRTVMGMQFRPMQETLSDTCASLLALSIVPTRP
eukprot:m.708425 g.708425  ORF g.708425 m.708425 type:complete len:69 (-) comp58744_c0_seq2:100-306(-)